MLLLVCNVSSIYERQRFAPSSVTVYLLSVGFLHKCTMTKEKRKGRLSDVLQEKASPWRDPAVEYLLESTKDWSDKGRQQGIREERKKKDGISKLKYYLFFLS